MRIAIVGAGPAGLVLAATLLRQASEKFKITIFERDSRERDQGAGWDIDADAKKAFENAGLDWRTIARSGSDTLRYFWVGGQMPVAAVGGFDQPETNRHVMREGLLKCIGDKATLKFSCGVSDAKLIENNAIALIGQDGEQLGTFDLAIDSSGGGSKLRKLRINEGDTDSYYTGLTMVNGLIESPEKQLDPVLPWMLGEGSVEIAGDRGSGPGGVTIWLQRYGAQQEDKRAKLMVYIKRDRPRELAAEVGLGSDVHLNSIQNQSTAGKKVRKFLHEEFGDKWPKMYHDMIDICNPLQVYDLFQYPSNVQLKDDHLPLMLIGDALHGMTPCSGSGGNLAVKDGTETAKRILDRSSTELKALIAELHDLEKRFLKRITFNEKFGKYHTDHYKNIYTSSTPMEQYYTSSQVFKWMSDGFGCYGHCVVGICAWIQSRNRKKGFSMPPRP